MMNIQNKQKDQKKNTTNGWRPISILQAFNVFLCLMIFPYMTTYTLTQLGVDLWLAATSLLVGLWAFQALYRRTKDVKIFNFED